MPYRYFVSLAFVGSPFCGWQVQPGSPTVQKRLEDAFATITKESVALTGCGRTDSGVHARIFFAHFDSSMSPASVKEMQLVYKLNRMLPPEVAIMAIYPVGAEAHARFDAISRTYCYQICTRKDPFYFGRSWLMERKMNVEAMQQAADLLLEARDFTSFSKSGTQVKTNICNVVKVRWSEEGHLLFFEIRADRFLRNMVRAIVGTLVEVGLGKIGPEDFAGIIEARDRSKAGYSAPGCGLFLTDIEYPDAVLGKSLSS